jgi:hypothetical protein
MTRAPRYVTPTEYPAPTTRRQRRRHRYPRYATRYDVRDAMFRLADIIGHIRAPVLRLCVVLWRSDTRVPMDTRRGRLAFWLNRRIYNPLWELERRTVQAGWDWTHEPGTPRIGARIGDA